MAAVAGGLAIARRATAHPSRLRVRPTRGRFWQGRRVTSGWRSSPSQRHCWPPSLLTCPSQRARFSGTEPGSRHQPATRRAGTALPRHQSSTPSVCASFPFWLVRSCSAARLAITVARTASFGPTMTAYTGPAWRSCDGQMRRLADLEDLVSPPKFIWLRLDRRGRFSLTHQWAALLPPAEPRVKARCPTATAFAAPTAFPSPQTAVSGTRPFA